MSKRQLQRSFVVSTNDDDDDDDDDAIFVLYCTNNRRRSNNNDQRQRRRLLPLEFPILIGVVFNQACVRACVRRAVGGGGIRVCCSRVPCDTAVSFISSMFSFIRKRTDGRTDGRTEGRKGEKKTKAAAAADDD